MLPIWWRWPVPESIRRSASPRSIPSITLWCRSTNPSLLHWRAACSYAFRSSAAAYTAAKDAEEDETADTAGDTDDEGTVMVDPIADFSGSRRALALTIRASASAPTRGPIEKVLLHTIASVGAEFGGSARKSAILSITRVCIVV